MSETDQRVRELEEELARTRLLLALHGIADAKPPGPSGGRSGCFALMADIDKGRSRAAVGLAQAGPTGEAVTAPTGVNESCETTGEKRARLLHLASLAASEEQSAEIDLDSGIKDVLDAFPHAVLLIDATHHIVMANRAAQDAIGMPAADLVGECCPRAVHGLDEPYPGCPLEDCLRCGAAVEKDLHIPEHGIWVESCIYPTRYCTDDGRLVYLHTVRDITARKATESELERNYQIQSALASLLRVSLSGGSIEAQMQEALDVVLSLTWLAMEHRGAIFLVDFDRPGVLRAAAQRGLAAPLLDACREVPFGRCLCGKAAASGETVFRSCVDEDHDTRYDGMQPHGHYCVPAIANGQVVGVLNLYVVPGRVWSQREQDFLEACAGVLAGIIQLRRTEQGLVQALGQVEETLKRTAEAMTRAIEVRDPYTAGHQQRVAGLACAIAHCLGWSEDAILGLRLAGLLHDIGKLTVPAEILSKPGRLTPAEFMLIKAHPEVGYEILKGVPFRWPIADLVRQHHEKLDGTGYPQGLKGDEILPGSRLLAVADVVEAVASHRPYRAALGIDKAVEIVTAGKGTHFDPLVVDACVRVLSEGFRFDSV